MSASDDGPRCRPGGGADLSRHRRRAGTLPQLQGSRGGVWADAIQVSIGRDQPNWYDIKMRRRNDASDALRSGPEHANPHRQMVLAQGLGNEDRQAPRAEKSNRGASAPAGRDYAPHLG